MRIDEVELRLIHVPFRTPFKTSFAVETEKIALLITVRSEGVEGYGETTMDPYPWFREETVAGGTFVIKELLVPDLLRNGCEHPSELVHRWNREWRGNPMAKSALELAVWDCYARQQGVPLRTLLGGDRTELGVGASLGMQQGPTGIADTLDTVRRHVEQGYKRVKLKIEPGWDVEVLRAVRAEFPFIELTVDANSAYTLNDLDLLREIDTFGLHYIEQPLHWDDLTDHVKVAEALHTPICLDESLTSPARVRAAIELGACSVVNMKVARVGGLQAVREIHDYCVARGVPLWCGGMLETGVGRAHNIHLGTMPGFVYPGDTASASRTYSRDIVEQQLETVNGIMPVPEGPGIGVTLDREFVNTVTVNTEVLR